MAQSWTGDSGVAGTPQWSQTGGKAEKSSLSPENPCNRAIAPDSSLPSNDIQIARGLAIGMQSLAIGAGVAIGLQSSVQSISPREISVFSFRLHDCMDFGGDSEDSYCSASSTVVGRIAMGSIFCPVARYLPGIRRRCSRLAI